MSKNNNVNPGQYKEAGRERQGEQLQQTDDKRALAQEKAARERTAKEPREPRRDAGSGTRATNKKHTS